MPVYKTKFHDLSGDESMCPKYKDQPKASDMMHTLK